MIREICAERAAKELEVPSDALYVWIKVTREGFLDISSNSHTLDSAINLAKELVQHCQNNNE